MPRNIRVRLIFYYGFLILFSGVILYGWLRYGFLDGQAMVIPLLLTVFVILTTYYQYYTSENEPGFNLPKYKFPYQVRRRWSLIHYVFGILYGIVLAAWLFTLIDAIDSMWLSYFYLIPCLLIIGYCFKGLYQLFKETEEIE